MNVERLQLVCMPKDLMETPKAEGSILIVADCGDEVWMGPLMQPLRGRPDTEVSCIRCVFRSEGFWRDLKKMTDGLRREMNAILGVAETDQLIAKHGMGEA